MLSLRLLEKQNRYSRRLGSSGDRLGPSEAEMQYLRICKNLSYARVPHPVSFKKQAHAVVELTSLTSTGQAGNLGRR